MILSTTERKERTGDEVSDAADLDCLCLRAGRRLCQIEINTKLAALCTRHSCTHTHTHTHIRRDGRITAGAKAPRGPKQASV